MDFAETTIAKIKSISQRSLARAWSRAARDAACADFADFSPGDRSHDPNYLAIWKVERLVERFEYVGLFQGAHIAVAFQSQWVGRRMSEVIPEVLRPAAQAAADHCRLTRRGVYMIYQAEDLDGREVFCERLLLPFCKKDAEVQQILASKEPISIAGDIVLTTALDRFKSGFQIAFAGSFEPERGNSDWQPASESEGPLE